MGYLKIAEPDLLCHIRDFEARAKNNHVTDVNANVDTAQEDQGPLEGPLQAPPNMNDNVMMVQSIETQGHHPMLPVARQGSGPVLNETHIVITIVAPIPSREVKVEFPWIFTAPPNAGSNPPQSRLLRTPPKTSPPLQRVKPVIKQDPKVQPQGNGQRKPRKPRVRSDYHLLTLTKKDN